jgi:hypothetical protein
MKIYYIGYHASFYSFQSEILSQLFNFYPLHFRYVAGTNLEKLYGLNFLDPDFYFVVGHNAEDIIDTLQTTFGPELRSKLVLEFDFIQSITNIANGLRKILEQASTAALQKTVPTNKLSRFELLVIK